MHIQIVSSTTACPGNIITSNFSVDYNAGATSIVSNSVGGNLEDLSNTGATLVSGNQITGSLKCLGDTSITGGGNTAAQKPGQCAAF
jgi:hypothetical protein